MSDIVYNKAIVNNQIVLDLSQDTATISDVKLGKTFHLANGYAANGTLDDNISLNSPSISVSNDTLYIVDANNGSFATSFSIYNNTTLITTISSSTYDLTQLEYGSYRLSVVANGDPQYFNSSFHSNYVYYQRIKPDEIWVFNDVVDLSSAPEVTSITFKNNDVNYTSIACANNRIRYDNINQSLFLIAYNSG